MTKNSLDMKIILIGSLLAMFALCLGYYLGYHNGVKQERQAWLATEQTLPDPRPTVTAGRPAIQTSRWTRTFYTNPYIGRTVIARSRPTPVNVPDPRDTLVK